MDTAIVTILPAIAWSIFIGCFFLAVSCGAIFAFHWFKYAQNHASALFAFVTYSVVSGFLLLGILAATIALLY